MKKYYGITPEGTKDMLFEECTVRRELEKKLADVFVESNYREVITPGFEYFDVFTKENVGMQQEEMYKFTDNKGRIIVMRPDSTLPIARMVTSRLNDAELPIRLFYSQNVYRNNPDLSGRSNEIFQMGIELIGAEGTEADVEAISLAIKAISSCSDDFRIEIGNAVLFKNLISKLNLSIEDAEIIRELIEAKNYAGLNEMLDSLQASDEAEAIRKLPRLFGGYDILSEAERICTDDESRSMLSYMRKLYRELDKLGIKDRIMIDLGLVQRHDYYSGVIFSIYTSASADAVIVGGRYDNLLEKFGKNLPAIGFSVDVSALQSIIANDEEKSISSIRKPIRIALTKGRIEKDVIKLFKKAGLDTETVENKGRKLLIPMDEYEIVFAKAPDVITYVEHGVCDIGIVGKDTISENSGSFFEILDLGMGNCKFSLAAPKDADFNAGFSEKTVATKYPNTARKFFDKMQMDVNIIKIEGSVELAPILGLADGIVDIVETGKTLEENGLEVIEDISEISTRMIVNTASLKMRKNEIEMFAEKLETAIKAEEI